MKKNMNFSLTEHHEGMLKEMANHLGYSNSFLLRRWIEKAYQKYTKKKEERQHEAKAKH
jgi:hypothetical protein